jgi:hypothetical protein
MNTPDEKDPTKKKEENKGQPGRGWDKGGKPVEETKKGDGGMGKEE